LLQKAYRYDAKGKRYIDTPLKYCFSDIGLRNARLGFRQQEENHIMENAVFNELITQGHKVDAGVVSISEKGAPGKSPEDLLRRLIQGDPRGNPTRFQTTRLSVSTLHEKCGEGQPERGKPIGICFS